MYILLQFNESPLHNASSKGHMEIVQMLLNKNANKDIQTDVSVSSCFAIHADGTVYRALCDRTDGQHYTWLLRRVIQK